jgi:Xaa-Pro aminopeptidase
LGRIKEMSLSLRKRRAAAAAKSAGVDGLLITHLPDVRYLCGFTGSSAALVLSSGRTVLFTDGRYTAQAKAEASSTRVVIATKPALTAACEWMEKAKVRRCGFDAAHTTVAGLELMRKAVSGKVRRAMFVPVGPLVSRLREIKDSDEIAKLPRRGFVTLDFGVILDGYLSDMTRTVHMGKAMPGERDVYDSVLEAQEAAVAAVAPGVTAGEVDEAARSVLRRVKLGQYFSHSTGHGVGLEIHEGPRLAARQKQVLEQGMVITIEPGVYIPGRFGLRIEDMVLVTAKGGEVLTPSVKAWIEL